MSAFIKKTSMIENNNNTNNTKTIDDFMTENYVSSIISSYMVLTTLKCVTFCVNHKLSIIGDFNFRITLWKSSTVVKSVTSFAYDIKTFFISGFSYIYIDSPKKQSVFQ